MEEEKSTEGVQAWADITQELRADEDGKSSDTESLAEFESMVAFSRFCESGEFPGLGPVEFTCLIERYKMGCEHQVKSIPESTMTPAMVVPWPPIHLVALCTVEFISLGR